MLLDVLQLFLVLPVLLGEDLRDADGAIFVPAALPLMVGLDQVQSILLQPEHFCVFVGAKQVFLSLEAFLERKLLIFLELGLISSDVVIRHLKRIVLRHQDHVIIVFRKELHL